MFVLKDPVVEGDFQNITEHNLFSTFLGHIISHIKYTGWSRGNACFSLRITLFSTLKSFNYAKKKVF